MLQWGILVFAICKCYCVGLYFWIKITKNKFKPQPAPQKPLSDNSQAEPVCTGKKKIKIRDLGNTASSVSEEYSKSSCSENPCKKADKKVNYHQSTTVSVGCHMICTKFSNLNLRNHGGGNTKDGSWHSKDKVFSCYVCRFSGGLG